VLLAACGGQRTPTATTVPQTPHVAPAAHRPATPDGDWSRFDYTASRSGVGPTRTGITSRNAPHLATRVIHIDGVADSSPIQLHAVGVRGRARDVAIVTTTYGHTIAFDPATGAKLWEFVPGDVGPLVGGPQITTASPVADPDRRYVYAASPDGVIHKLAVASGVQAWSARITFDPTREKIGGALNISGSWVLAVTGGYYGDNPTYQGHVALIDRATGHVAHVFNTLCSDRHALIKHPSSCPASDSAIWARAGAIVEPASGRLLVATGNGPFNGSTNWGDSVLELAPDASRAIGSWTPRNQAELSASDTDVGSTGPALLGGGLAVQGGKDGLLVLLDLAHRGLGQTGGELQTLQSPGGGEVLTAPAVWRDYLFVADDSGTAAYVLSGRRLRLAWQDGSSGTSPIIAGGLLYIYDEAGGALRILQPTSGKEIASLPAAQGHWNTPIVVGGRVILPVGGSTADTGRSGEVLVFHIPGR
jgi:outer membrane protein assembly factor BamB